MQFDAQHYPYASQRTVTYGRRGMVAASQPLAAEAGLQILRQGGNAVDAALAAAAALPVVEPTSNGIGGDLFAIVCRDGKLFGINSSGPAPQSLTPEAVRNAGHESEIPRYGWLPVTVPGVPAGWAALNARFGRFSLAEVIEPAAKYAEEGYPVSPITSFFWKRCAGQYKKLLTAPECQGWFDVFAPDFRGPEPGEIWKNEHMAASLRSIGETEGESFYRGDLAKKILDFSHNTGGYLRDNDLAAYEPEWVDPISINYRGYTVWELPPNGQGLVALIALGILDGLDYDPEGAQWTHAMIEAVKMAFSDGLHWLTDPEQMMIEPKRLLDPAYLQSRRKELGTQAILRSPGRIDPGGTVYLAAADGEGTMVSLIQSNYVAFGSGVVVPKTGIALQNRGSGFSLDPSHCNYLRPGRRSYHTIIPGFLTQGADPVGPFGVMGGFMQPQGHVQVLSRCLDQGLNPQAALDGPRFFWSDGLVIDVEASMPASLVASLRERGHAVRVTRDVTPFGRGQIIWNQPGGILAGGTEPRTDGMVSVW